MPEDLQKTRSIELCRLDQLSRNRNVEITEKQRCECNAIDHMHQHQSGDCVRETEGRKQSRHRQQDHLEWNEATKEQGAKEELTATKSPLG